MRPEPASDEGQATAFSVVMSSALLLLAAFVLDVGSALAERSAALHTAQEAARVGAQQIDLALYRAEGTVTLEPEQATAAAEDHLDGAGMDGTATAQGETVTVTAHTTATFTLLPLPERTASGTASATPLTNEAPEP